jgi:galactokinase
MLRTVSDEANAAAIVEKFSKLFGSSPAIFRAPGRVNLIGEHTDYNDGFVMPAAIGFYTWIAATPREDRTIQVHSEQFNETVELPLDALAGPPRNHWSDFIRGVAAVIETRGYKLFGANLLIDGHVPMGSGLSSSASLEVATAFALRAISHTDIPPLELVKLSQRAEHEYVGTRCGIMDQFIAVFGRSTHALLLDCRSLNYEALPIPSNVRLVISNSMVKHELATGEYNRRREDCETGVHIFQKHMPYVLALRDVTLADLEKYKSDFPERVYRRCRHVISEDDRVISAAAALRSGDLPHFGKMMNESHRSLRDDYEVSAHELDLLVSIASTLDGVYGTRMTGGGFGGSTITLVKSDAAENFRLKIAESYRKQTGITPDVYICTATQGAAAWPTD